MQTRRTFDGDGGIDEANEGGWDPDEVGGAAVGGTRISSNVGAQAEIHVNEQLV